VILIPCLKIETWGTHASFAWNRSRLPCRPLPLTIHSDVNTVRAIYPGTFDPLTNGHLDLIARGSKIFDHLVVAILNNSEKEPLFPVAERVEMITEATREFGNISVSTFDGLLVEFARQQQAQALLRGIRAISDYEYEFQMALMNRRLAPQLETVFMMPAEKYSYVSSRLIREVFRLGGSVEGLVPPSVLERMRAGADGARAAEDEQRIELAPESK
jgi:pantetheine-phosphate adenylyltransferase